LTSASVRRRKANNLSGRAGGYICDHCSIAKKKCSFSRSDSTCDACEKRGRRCGGGKSAGDRRHLKADVDPIEGFRAVLRTLDQAMVQTVGSKQTVTLLKEVLASHNLDQDLEAGENSTASGREAGAIDVEATPNLPSASPPATPPLAGYEYNYLSDSTAEPEWNLNVFTHGSADFQNVEIHDRSGEIWCPQSSVIENYESTSNTIAPASMHLQTSSLDYRSSESSVIPEYY